MPNITELATRLRDLKDQKDEAEDRLKKLNEEIRQIAVEQLPQLMEDQEIEKFTVENVGTIFIRTDIYTSVNEPDREKLHAWLRETGNGAIVREYVFPQTLKAF